MEQVLPSAEKAFANFTWYTFPSEPVRVPLEVQVFPLAIMVAVLALAVLAG